MARFFQTDDFEWELSFQMADYSLFSEPPAQYEIATGIDPAQDRARRIPKKVTRKIRSSSSEQNSPLSI
jgi:hypothetical protein